MLEKLLCLPVLDGSRCTGCGDCVQICPTDCLEKLGGSVWLPRPADCIACGACAAICPVEALQLPRFPDLQTGR